MSMAEKARQRLIGAFTTGCFALAITLVANTPDGPEFLALPWAIQVSCIGFFVGLIGLGLTILLWGREPLR